MAETADLLVEIGTEELPPKSLRGMSEAFGEALCERLASRILGSHECTVYATPRRLAVLVPGVPLNQPDRDVERRGPALDAAFDADGKATKAAEGFARSCGVEVAQLERLETADGRWLLFRSTQVGESTASLLPAVVEEALARIPVARRMRWADLEAEFVRPVHWVTILHGSQVIETSIMGVKSGAVTYGHRFHHPHSVEIGEASNYAGALYGGAHVVADFAARMDMIRSQVEEAAEALGGRAVIDNSLLEENAALVEWPVAVTGSFDVSFLSLPDCVLSATMQGHQRYFPVMGDDGALMPNFIAISNIESRHPETVRNGNERVIRPRLADAAFFFEADQGQSLGERRDALKDIVFQEKLGSVFDKSERVSRLAGIVAIAMGLGPEEIKLARHAATLYKCDLVTEMVGEFPELQGAMGREYALVAREDLQVANAIGESYMPRFAGDRIPSTAIGRALSIADRLDTLLGIFLIGEAPTGDKDPFALRRAALGALRIMIEAELPLDLHKLLKSTVEGYEKFPDAAGAVEQVMEFVLERLKAYFIDRGVSIDVFLSVQAREPTEPHDFARRVYAVDAFRKLPEAASLAAANKRIQNILKQAQDAVPEKVDESLFADDAEWNLAAKTLGLGPRVRDLLKKRDYTSAMTSLAGLRESVDDFFDNVKVMEDDEQVRKNRLALLRNISNLFLETADISRLQA
ncbi:MAG: glycine--tRNA ligase subunit beta [Gammaproteobacteria bacterium]|nr:glycine--tRNA ligase subunit beta [Gammaproteobacteria bacterium]NIM71985.1 glycine--tRNA ligase subunit beta [Gammaproteobacteria bacterium]NIN38172.1 glycine--tRNA ligase subunit beta [Gammaproteobacteria bacterium]NIO25596.1 glycine--tRNA ligase subunit beta [Gammaproteobacteria bacterium]NIO64355.1 glycine--tRNA ligase subunit beta [Gammaproteobacteria bacterium]